MRSGLVFTRGIELRVGVFTGFLAAHDVMCVVTLSFHFINHGTRTTRLELKLKYTL